MVASTIGACATARTLTGKLEIEIFINATIAGGISIASAANIIDAPFAALIIGLEAGTASTYGYVKLGPYLRKKIGLHDTSGVMHRHCIPGLLAGIFSAILCTFGNNHFEDDYGAIRKEGRNNG